MKLFVRGFILLLLAASSILATQAPSASVEGVVLDLLAGNPLPKVTLDLQASDNPGVRYPGTTSADGRFVFRGVRPGRYSLTAMRTGYVRSQYGQRGPNGIAASLTVAAGQAVANVQLSMVRSGAISGRLLDVEGEPVAEAQVHAWKVAFRDGWRIFEPIVSLASNDLGEFRLFGLPPGQYYISAQPEPPDYIRAPSFAALGPTMPGAVVTSFSAGQGGAGLGDPATQPRRAGMNWSPVYFGGTPDPYAATPINLPPGNEIRNADIVVDRIPMVRLSGLVVDASGAPVSNARIMVTPAAPGVSFAASTTVNVFGGRINLADAPFINSGANGDFGRAFPRGMYLLTAIAGNQGSRTSGQAVADLRGAAETNFIRIALAPSRELTGQIVVEGTTDRPADMSRIRVGLRSTVAAAMDIAPQSVSPSCAFVLRDIPAGDYLFNVSSNVDKSYVRSIQAGRLDLLENGLRGSGFTEGAVRIVIAMNAAELRGNAVDESGVPMSNVTVVLLPDESHRHRVDLYRSTTTDASGAYQFDRVSPGTYKLFAWEDVEKDAWRNPAFMSLYEGRGQTLQINEDASAMANVNVLRLR